MAQRFDLVDVMDSLPDPLPLGIRQRLSLAVAMIHSPDMLILDEPTSGVDPVARDGFWQILSDLSRKDNVTIFVSTHFMNEAERCDRISLMHAGKVLVSDYAGQNCQAAFRQQPRRRFHRLSGGRDRRRRKSTPSTAGSAPAICSYASSDGSTAGAGPDEDGSSISRRMFAYTRREALELRRDPIRATLATIGSVILMFVMGYGINIDIENLTFAALDRDDTTISRDYILQIAGSRYFTEKAPITDYADLDRRMRSGELSLAIEIPPGFGRDVARGRNVEIGAWIDGAMPTRAETVQRLCAGYACEPG